MVIMFFCNKISIEFKSNFFHHHMIFEISRRQSTAKSDLNKGIFRVLQSNAEDILKGNSDSIL
ncbi:hypothetical protein FF38_00442 [Lucilia cuprina]|uniref:Uncharacterized protein n=1 Tax=Lucilia cuprina TaxID=7375 RepID=A0A0L0BKM2_LUCCU|nr:hypothetical protein FF38_00442 [Lucilia cuprina]